MPGTRDGGSACVRVMGGVSIDGLKAQFITSPG